MKNRFISLLLALVIFVGFAVCASAADNSKFVYDDADLLSASEEAALAKKLEEVSSTYNAQIIVTTVSKVTGDDVDQFLEYWYDSNGFGYGENRDGVLLLICMDTRDYRILSNGYAGKAIDPNTIDRIGDKIASDLSDGEYAEAFGAFADECGYYLNGYLNGFPFAFGRNLVICLVIGVLAGFVVGAVLKGQLKSVRKQDKANVYVKPGSMNLTAQNDLFLYRTVSRTKKETSSNNNSSSGSSRSTGGDKF